MNTPSGTLNYALDKFINHYAAQGYDWMNRAKATYYTFSDKTGKYVKQNIETLTNCCDDFIFFKPNSILSASAIINENKITGYTIEQLKLS